LIVSHCIYILRVSTSTMHVGTCVYTSLLASLEMDNPFQGCFCNAGDRELWEEMCIHIVMREARPWLVREGGLHATMQPYIAIRHPPSRRIPAADKGVLHTTLHKTAATVEPLCVWCPLAACCCAKCEL